MTATGPTVRRRLGPEERRAVILAAARAAFATASYAEVGVPEVARRAGGSPAIVFHYFGSKEGLYAALLEADLNDLAERQQAADAALPPNTSARDRVRTWVLAHLDHVAAHARGSLAREEPVATAAIRDRAREKDLAFLAEILQPADAVRDRFALLGFLGFLDAVGAAWASDGCPEDDRHPLVEAALGALQGGLGLAPLRRVDSHLVPSHEPLRLTAPSGGTVEVATPVVLAPMAGITNPAYRQLCLEQGAGLYVCEMITSRGIVEKNPKTLDMLRFAPGETVRSVQLYGVDADVMAKAAHILCDELGVHHIDINMGCPVPKVTRRGGGGALPWKTDRLAEILTKTVAAADVHGVPVTVKTRMGIDDDHQTYLDAGRIAQDAGAAAIALHARTVAQAYSGQARWDAIATLAEAVDIPVLGNGDIWEGVDALRMVEQTGAAGVVIGRGCLGRPWLFRDLADAFAGRPVQPYPTLGEVTAMLRRHAVLLAEIHGERWGLTDLRKHMAWYFKGFPLGGDLRREFAMVSSLGELDALIAQLDPDATYPVQELGTPRGRQGTPRAHVTLPYGWLDSRTIGEEDLSAAESDVSGG